MLRPQIAGQLVHKRPGDLLPLIKSSLHVRSGLGFFKCRAGADVFSLAIFFSSSRAPAESGSCLACAIGFGYRSL